MKIEVVGRGSARFAEAGCLALPMFEGRGQAPLSDAIDPSHVYALQRAFESGLLKGEAEDVYYLPAPGGACRGIAVVGLGKRGEFTNEVARRAMGKACATLERNEIRHVVVDLTGVACDPEPFVEALILGQYRFDRYRADNGAEPTAVERVTLISPQPSEDAEAACRQAAAAAEGANSARDLAHTPANELTPGRLASYAHALAEETGCACEVFAQDWIAKKGMGALLAVARGSAEGPRLIVMKHTPQPGQPAVVLAGKGVTFDSGGISIKPSEGMHEMKYDMCGAAAVLGAMKTLSQMRVQTNVIAIVPTVENMPGDRATRPGDIVRAYNGKTIEIQNTDAEGRLILADALAYASDVYQPAAMADLATLTGAAIITLGHQAAAVMSTDDGLYDEIHAAAERTGERIWRLPLWDDYAEGIKAHHADLRNIGPKREAGTIIGGVFLQQFVGDTPWAHIDIAAMAWGVKNRPYWNEKNATGFGARLLTRWVLDRAAKGSE